jgi:hypothetical protein
LRDRFAVRHGNFDLPKAGHDLLCGRRFLRIFPAPFPGRDILHQLGFKRARQIIFISPPCPAEFSIGHDVNSKVKVNAIMEQAEKAGATIAAPAHDHFWEG